ncbi:conjugal transfer protein TrbH [Peteryoungia ipomoeae]|uniref:Conjugal transfer protein TrbH n=1 Tax=Peteryoungia ipomoeae TaxID=1210932 RepID=A0A4S8NTA7_9HYPH|nr:conjugal transfer protein TrbH [Peteryoungia ipomoeae]THV19875.1 conjugal transfer protein TrbH [Peteryoungia ipomoeae]
MRFRYLLALLIPLNVSGCQTGAPGSDASSAPVEISGPAASAIAGDMAARFAEQAGAAKTALKLQADASEYSIALESALKGWGYTVVREGAGPDTENAKATKPTALSYGLSAAEGQVLARISTDAFAMGRAYSVNNGTAAPSSPLSLTTFN